MKTSFCLIEGELSGGGGGGGVRRARCVTGVTMRMVWEEEEVG